MTVIWQVSLVERIAPALLDGLKASPLRLSVKAPRVKAFGAFTDNRKLAEAAMRRWRAREIQTR